MLKIEENDNFGTCNIETYDKDGFWIETELGMPITESVVRKIEFLREYFYSKERK